MNLKNIAILLLIGLLGLGLGTSGRINLLEKIEESKFIVVYKDLTVIQDLFNFVVEDEKYKDFCKEKQNNCPLPAVITSSFGEEEKYIAGKFNWFSPDEVRINIDNRKPFTAEWKATVVHEFTHYLQYLQGEIGPTKSCESLQKGEFEAYEMTSKYLKEKHNIDEHFGFEQFMLIAMCQVE